MTEITPLLTGDEEAARARKALEDALAYITPEDLDNFIERRGKWLASPNEFLVWTVEQSMLYVQVLDKVAIRPPVGKGSGTLALQAIRDIKEMVFVIVQTLREAGGLGDDEDENESVVARSKPQRPKSKRATKGAV